MGGCGGGDGGGGGGHVGVRRKLGETMGCRCLPPEGH